MKNLTLSGICLALLLACTPSFAQEKIPVNEPDLNKPKLFSDLPDKIPVHLLDLQSFVNTENGKQVSLKIPGNNNKGFDGKVIAAAAKYNNTIRSVVIRSADFNGATLTLSSSIQPNGTVKFTGRIISPKHGDLFELQKENDQYILVKKNYYDLINE
ncbi:MAG: hypothetical protein JNK14_09895 [Chitinophagaceae bacterium]|nr:hypothetical protein [Chitinophagaceae bacterium]